MESVCIGVEYFLFMFSNWDVREGCVTCICTRSGSRSDSDGLHYSVIISSSQYIGIASTLAMTCTCSSDIERTLGILSINCTYTMDESYVVCQQYPVLIWLPDGHAYGSGIPTYPYIHWPTPWKYILPLYDLCPFQVWRYVLAILIVVDGV